MVRSRGSSQANNYIKEWDLKPDIIGVFLHVAIQNRRIGKRLASNEEAVDAFMEHQVAPPIFQLESKWLPRIERVHYRGGGVWESCFTYRQS